MLYFALQPSIDFIFSYSFVSELVNEVILYNIYSEVLQVQSLVFCGRKFYIF